tara:strand:- start:130 stop:522 length:393 start_codon:yes stop_codon:yes gene_type:complete
MASKLTEFTGDCDGNSNRHEHIPVPICTNSNLYGNYDTRKCTRRNFVPNRHVGDVKPEVWRETYREHITDIYRIIRRVIEKEFPDMKINWENPRNQHNLIKLLFYSSSKHIPDYMIEQDYKKESDDYSDY